MEKKEFKKACIIFESELQLKKMGFYPRSANFLETIRKKEPCVRPGFLIKLNQSKKREIYGKFT